MPLTITPNTITPSAITPAPVTVDLPPITVQPANVQPAAVQPADVIVTDAQMIAALSANYVITPKATLVATSNPFTISVDYPNYVAPPGKTLKSVAAVGAAPNAFAAGSSTHFPFLVTSTNNGSWSGGLVTLVVTATFTDNTSIPLGSVTAQLNATNGSIVPTDGIIFDAGVFHGKGDFDYGGFTADYFTYDATQKQYVCGLTTSTGGGGWQPYFPVTPTHGFDTSKFKFLELVFAPSTANETFLVSMMADNDVVDGINLAIGANTQNWGTPAAQAAGYGPTAAPAGLYSTYKIPVADFKLTNAQILKINFGYAASVPVGTVLKVLSAKFTN